MMSTSTREWICTVIVLGCVILTGAMFGYVGLQPTDTTVKRAEKVAKEARAYVEKVSEEVTYSARISSELWIRFQQLEKRVEQLEGGQQ